jgi:hypothetical protein
MARQPLNWREWLEDMRRFNGRDAQRATDVLALLDELEHTAESYLAVFEALERQGHQDTDADGFDVAKRVETLAARDLGVRSLCVDAGLLRDDDCETDVTPLLRMFLPVD